MQNTDRLSKAEKPNLLDTVVEITTAIMYVVAAACVMSLIVAGVVKVGMTLTEIHYEHVENRAIWISAPLTEPALDPSASDKNSSTAHTPTKPVRPSSIEAYPAISTTKGAYPIGTSLNDHPSTSNWNHGMTYRCDRGLTSFTISYKQGVEYHGTNIKFKGDSTISRGKINQQTYVTLTFTGTTAALGRFTSHAKSIIIRTDDADPRIHHDDRLINITPAMIAPGGIRLTKANFLPHQGFINAVTFCTT